MVDVDGAIVEGLQVVAKGPAGKKVMKVSAGGSFELEGLGVGEYALQVESTGRTKVTCKETTVKVERNVLNEAVVRCEKVENEAMEIEGGGSFILLAVALVALFVFVEREQLRYAF